MSYTLFQRHGEAATTADAMGNMDGMSNGSMSGGMMMMVFQTENATPLYSNAWTPRSTGAYAATCIFLVVLAVVARLLLAGRSIVEARWLDREMQRRYVAANGKIPLSEQIMTDPKAQQMTLTANGVEETVFVVARHNAQVRPWRFSVDPLRAVMDTVIVGVGYLLYVSLPSPPSSPSVFFFFSPPALPLREKLWTNSVCSMLAVMTMNVGYFLSVLAGVLVGSLAVGRFSPVGDH